MTPLITAATSASQGGMPVREAVAVRFETEASVLFDLAAGVVWRKRCWGMVNDDDKRRIVEIRFAERPVHQSTDPPGR